MPTTGPRGGRRSLIISLVLSEHLIGLLLGTEDDWPCAFETLVERLGPIEHRGETHTFRVERVKNEPVAHWELEKVRMSLRRSRAQQLQSTLFRALLIGQYAVFYNDPNLINEIEAKFNAVTKEDLQRVARTYFKDTNRTVITTVPKPRGASAPGRTGE